MATATNPVDDGLDDSHARSDPRQALQPLPRVMVGATAAMVTVTVALTALAGPLYGITDRASNDLRERTPYLTAVFGGEESP